jgi:hypothetical protein
MATKDPRIDAYIEKAAPFARPILRHLRKVVHAGCPDVVETLKWRTPSFEHKGILCGMAAFKQHCVFGFWKDSLVTGREGATGPMSQFGRLTALSDLPSEKVLLGYVRKAVALNEEGVPPPWRRKAKPKPALTVPAYFLVALRKNKKALATFEGFSASHRREYVEWVTEAKGEETRQRRLGTAVAWMAEGKGRNWKYER